ncbi:MAG: lysophospholipid acyltransferase family protein [Verrucomicrobia bacterium]|jgi:Kdo2-lipid IVA lauroyltransferase/acyltransferase|nr:lysophospholipid acyltransferase family protein [Verrucomicrobiota bacterium]
MTYRAKHILEYALLRTVAMLVCILPYRMALSIGWGLAFIAFRLFSFRKNETLRRMRLVFGNRFSAGQYRRMAWIACRNTAFNAIDVLRAPRITQKWCNHVFDSDETIRILRAQVEMGKGGVMATPHMGCWDLAGINLSVNGIPTLSIVAKQRNPLVNAYFDRVRSAPGMKTLSRGQSGILKAVVRHLKEAEFLAILPDARMRTPGIEMPLLGGTANLGTGTASFARMTRLPIFPIICSREGWTRHRMRSLPTVQPDMTLDKQADVQRMTAIVLEMFDREIQAAPEQWFWLNKRWVLDPVIPPERKPDDPNQ